LSLRSHCSDGQGNVFREFLRVLLAYFGTFGALAHSATHVGVASVAFFDFRFELCAQVRSDLRNDRVLFFGFLVGTVLGFGRAESLEEL
jgi:hypothetical protein